MKGGSLKLSEIFDIYEEYISKFFGYNKDLVLSGIAKLDNVDKNKIDWISINNENKIEMIEKSKSKVLIIHEEIDTNLLSKFPNKVFILTKDPKLLFTIIANDNFIKKTKPLIHPAAYVDPEAAIAANVYIGPGCVIHKCSIGAHTQLLANVTINDDVIIGENVIIKPGAVLGFEGFGFVKTPEGDLLKFPQIGRLIIHDNVEIGSNTCIDRGSLVDTVIGKGTKINDLCHIAHNVIIGKNTTITGLVNVSGSCIIGNNVHIAPSTTVRDHITIGDNVLIGQGSTVIKDVPKCEVWAGNPARFLRSKNKD